MTGRKIPFRCSPPNFSRYLVLSDLKGALKQCAAVKAHCELSNEAPQDILFGELFQTTAIIHGQAPSNASLPPMINTWYPFLFTSVWPHISARRPAFTQLCTRHEQFVPLTCSNLLILNSLVAQLGAMGGHRRLQLGGLSYPLHLHIAEQSPVT